MFHFLVVIMDNLVIVCLQMLIMHNDGVENADGINGKTR